MRWYGHNYNHKYFVQAQELANKDAAYKEIQIKLEAMEKHCEVQQQLLQHACNYGSGVDNLEEDIQRYDAIPWNIIWWYYLPVCSILLCQGSTRGREAVECVCKKSLFILTFTFTQEDAFTKHEELVIPGLH